MRKHVTTHNKRKTYHTITIQQSLNIEADQREQYVCICCSAGSKHVNNDTIFQQNTSQYKLNCVRAQLKSNEQQQQNHMN